MRYYPGTKVEKKDLSGEQFLQGIFMATNGLVMQQLNEITGVATPAIQNWVSRGFISRPINKRYNKDTTARIFIINSLRNTMSLDDIKNLLVMLNGSVYSREDDIIPESDLYAMFCKIIFDARFSFKTIELLVNEAIEGFNSHLDLAKQRLEMVMKILCENYLAGELLEQANNTLNALALIANAPITDKGV
ncbi:MAG: DUF1836 domain-containing protein [Clostridia bacterium]|nr:DUF1836 domain-containing protein [Clostridia bacterium]